MSFPLLVDWFQLMAAASQHSVRVFYLGGKPSATEYEVNMLQ